MVGLGNIDDCHGKNALQFETPGEDGVMRRGVVVGIVGYSGHPAIIETKIA